MRQIHHPIWGCLPVMHQIQQGSTAFLQNLGCKHEVGLSMAATTTSLSNNLPRNPENPPALSRSNNPSSSLQLSNHPLIVQLGMIRKQFCWHLNPGLELRRGLRCLQWRGHRHQCLQMQDLPVLRLLPPYAWRHHLHQWLMGLLRPSEYWLPRPRLR